MGYLEGVHHCHFFSVAQRIIIRFFVNDGTDQMQLLKRQAQYQKPKCETFAKQRNTSQH